MKNISIITIFACLLIATNSCTNDIDPKVSPGGFELRKDATVVPAAVLLPANDANAFIKLEWDQANNGAPSESKYEVIVSDHDNDPDFSDAQVFAGVGTENTDQISSFTVVQFNELINKLPSFNCDVMNIDIRVKSKLGVSSNALIQYSNPITVAVKGYSKSLPILAFATDAATAATAQQIKSSDYRTFTDYEGYAYLQPGTYKFYKPNSCGSFSSPVAYGINAGSLVQDGTNGFVVTTAGHYLIKVNMDTLTYTISQYTTFGIFGPAKGIPTGVNRAMTYNETNKKWELTFELFKGRKFKFRSMNAATAVSILGPTALGSTVLVESATSADVRVPGDDDGTKQNYKISLDVNNPRQYTYSLEIPN